MSQLDEFFGKLGQLTDGERLITFEAVFALPLFNSSLLREV